MATISRSRRRRTKKTPVIGAVERGGKVVARIAEDLSAKGVLSFVTSVADTAETILVTDEYKAYDSARCNHGAGQHQP